MSVQYILINSAMNKELFNLYRVCIECQRRSWSN